MGNFKPITGYDGLYSVNDTGQVWSERNEKMLCPAIDKYGYYYYVFCVSGKRKTVKAHRLVAEAFIPNPERKPTVDHINGDRKDNRVENLRWATNKEQTRNPITYKKLSKNWDNEKLRAMGAIRNFGRKPVIAIQNDVVVGAFPSLLSASKTLGVNYSKASECANGKRTQVDGYKFEWKSSI